MKAIKRMLEHVSWGSGEGCKDNFQVRGGAGVFPWTQEVTHGVRGRGTSHSTAQANTRLDKTRQTRWNVVGDGRASGKQLHQHP